MQLASGLTARIRSVVTEADTAPLLGSGDVPVLGTPRVVALVEAATVAAIAGHLRAGITSVGTRLELTHAAPTPVGRTVEAEATLSTVDGRTLTFAVRLWAGPAIAAEGTVRRVLVDRDRFLDKATAPVTPGPAEH